MYETEEAMERGHEELFDSMMFSELLETKIDVRAPCARCQGRGIRNGDKCEVCEGDKIVVQGMSLYKLAKAIYPVIVREMSKAAAAAAGQ